MPRPRASNRGLRLEAALRAVLLLRRGRWTVQEAAEELRIHWRTMYRVITSLRSVGITVDVSREPLARGYVGYYSVPPEPLRKLLGL